MILRWVRKVLGFRDPDDERSAKAKRLERLSVEARAVTAEARREIERGRVIRATRGATNALQRGHRS